MRPLQLKERRLYHSYVKYTNIFIIWEEIRGKRVQLSQPIQVSFVIKEGFFFKTFFFSWKTVFIPNCFLAQAYFSYVLIPKTESSVGVFLLIVFLIVYGSQIPANFIVYIYLYHVPDISVIFSLTKYLPQVNLCHQILADVGFIRTYPILQIHQHEIFLHLFRYSMISFIKYLIPLDFSFFICAIKSLHWVIPKILRHLTNPEVRWFSKTLHQGWLGTHFLMQMLYKVFKIMKRTLIKVVLLDSSLVMNISSSYLNGIIYGDSSPPGAILYLNSFRHGSQNKKYYRDKVENFIMTRESIHGEEIKIIHVQTTHSGTKCMREKASSRDIQEALHELLCCTNVSTKEGIHLVLVELLKNLTKYPTDRNSIWKCLKFLGSRHPTLVLPLVPELLSTHPFFDTAEPSMDDSAYTAVLVLIFNAAKTCPTMPALFSDHTFRLPGRKLVSSAVSPSIAPHEDPSHQFLQQSLERVYSFQHLDPQGTQELLEFTIWDLQRLGELQSELAGVADFSATYLRCQLFLIMALQEKLWNVAAPLYLKQSDLASAAAKQIMEETCKMEFMYSGVENKQVVIIHHIRLQAKALQLIVTARTTRGVDPLFGMCENFLQEVDFFQRCFIADLPHLQDSFVDKLLDLMPRLMTSKPVEVVKILQTMLRQSILLHLLVPEQIHKASATITEPAGESDNPLQFTSGLVVALDVDATLEHVQDPQSTVKVQVLYPYGQAQMIHPKPADFWNPGPGRHRLITHTSPILPGQNHVEISIKGTIPFSKSVKVYVMPKPTRR
ncbi:unnamed protein product [Nyctereutes procyonoides]|uniref:(raccoon dog) hypothetical protein n=1 Tax=Nyctereutes procyonoides TaxID=34880 RepID=A0A811ZYN3_NYCPR|nr:unnamed protein product [Nyctereutes procyonoides]